SEERPDQPADAACRLHESEGASLPAAINHLRSQTAESRNNASVGDGHGSANREKHRNRRDQQQQRQSEREETQTCTSERCLAKRFDQPSDQAALQDDTQDSDKTKYVTRVPRIEAEMLLREEGEERRHDGEPGDREKVGEDDGAEHAGVAVPENLG